MGIGTDLAGLSQWAIDRTRRRLDGLTDDELRWQPVAGSWTVRRLRDGRVVVDNRPGPGPDVPPPSIAWRIAHLVGVYGSSRNARWLRAPDELFARATRTAPWEMADDADGARALLDRAMDYWMAVVASVAEEQWFTPLGPGCEPWHESTLVAFAHHQLDEAIHHGAEVALLRDLYPHLGGASGGDDPRLAATTDVDLAAELGRWDLVEALVAEGTPMRTTGCTALHQAAAVGDLAIVELLVGAGAALDATDPEFHGTPLVWARYFGCDDVAAYLEARA
jgi:hypothetical protein